MNLIAYGSLMYPKEHAAFSPKAVIPVWVHGFRRAFDQLPMWRGDGTADHRVLAVRHDPAARFNGILLLGVAANWTPKLDYRERGYVRTTLPKQGLEAFAEDHAAALVESRLSACELYVGRGEQQRASGTPLAEYHALCRQACASWGESFATAFEQTTMQTPVRGSLLRHPRSTVQVSQKR